MEIVAYTTTAGTKEDKGTKGRREGTVNVRSYTEKIAYLVG